MPRAVLLTGASRGYGQALAESLASEAAATRRPLHMALVSRDAAGLAETERAALAVAAAASPEARVTCTRHSADLARPSVVEAQVEAALASLKGTLAAWSAGSSNGGRGAELLVLHNAGTLGRLSYVSELTAAETAEALDLNVTSVAVLTSAILRRFLAPASVVPGGLRLRIVNVSSLLAVQAFPAWSLYATGKAARDMLMRCIAEEAKAKGEDVRTLNWAPGPLRTAMTDQILQTCANEGVRENFVAMDREGKLLDPRQSADRLVFNVLAGDEYVSGDHVDFFDIDGPRL